MSQEGNQNEDTLDQGATPRPRRGRNATQDGRRELSFEVRHLWKIAAIAAFTFFVIHLVGAATAVLLVIFGGLILAAYFTGMGHFIERHTPLGYRASIAAVYLLHLLAAAALVPWWMAQGQGQAEQLAEELPRAFSQLKTQVENSTLGGWLIAHAPEPSTLLPSDGGMSRIQRMASTVIGALAGFAVLLFVGIYVGVDPQIYRRGLLHLLPPPRRRRAEDVLDDLVHTMRMWVLGRVVSAAIIGVGVTIGLWILGIPLALMIGLLSGALTFIPNFGPLMSVAPPALLALTQSPNKVLWVLGLYAALQLVESYVLTPVIEHRAVKVPPALMLSVQIIFSVLAGIVGLALAAPLTAVVMVLAQHLYIRDILADEDFVEGGDEEEHGERAGAEAPAE